MVQLNNGIVNSSDLNEFAIKFAEGRLTQVHSQIQIIFCVNQTLLP